ncbi:MAG: hypothetical protein COS98_00425 [Parcubacteria group bacterium CG07_land_8_20_14_0_80_35_11]|nr:MAG: hypothetical protein COS98_00425 [Parcubacteria group bacterium CG07_land_8_20_14_0_80_35_11]
MFKEIGYILISFLIAYLAFEGLLFLLEKDYGIKLPIGEELFLSSNGGENWLAIESPSENVISGKTLSFDPENPQNLYLASPRGILYSTNKGKKFKVNGTKFETETEPVFISEVISPLENPDIIYLISEEIGRNKVLVSYNKGETFRPIFISQKDNKVSAFGADPFFPYTLYLGTQKGNFLKSEDFGSSWEEKKNFSQKIAQIAPNPHQKGEIYVLLSVQERDPFNYWSQRIPAKIMISYDAANSFREFKTKMNISQAKKIVFDPVINRTYFVSDFSLFKKEGSRIEALKIISSPGQSGIHSFTIDPKNSNILYLGMGELIYKSEDSGKNWGIIETPIRGIVKEIKINPQDSQTILLSIEKTL